MMGGDTREGYLLSEERKERRVVREGGLCLSRLGEPDGIAALVVDGVELAEEDVADAVVTGEGQ
jgi:hypothetical protein